MEIAERKQAADSATALANGRLWGHRAREWSQLMEPNLRPLYEAVHERLATGPGHRLLDAGCGAGLAASIAARRGARVTGLDAAARLLEIARERVPQGDFRVGELEALPFADASFDRVTGVDAFPYAARPAVALAEARRVCRPTAWLAIATWGPPESMEAAPLLAALKPLLPPAPAGAPDPCALSDEARLRDFARSGGFEALDMFDTQAPWIFADLGTALRGLKSSGVAAKAIAYAGEAAVDEAHARALTPFRRADGGYRAVAVFRTLLARPANEG